MVKDGSWLIEVTISCHMEVSINRATPKWDGLC